MKTVSISLSPNTEKDDISLAIKELKSKNKIIGPEIQIFENNFRNYFNFLSVFSLNSGRSSLLVILKALGIEAGDEVIVQAFTCNAVINPILKQKAIPVYIDIDQTLNINILEIEKKINNKTKAIIVQHTFGMPAKIEEIKNICTKYNLYLIEDCAHALGAKYNNKYCGTFGDVAFFSFGRDKVISCVYGGMIGINNPKLEEKIKIIYDTLDYPTLKWVNNQLRHPIVMNLFVLPLYNFLNIGKVFLELSIRLNLISKAVTAKEYIGTLPENFPEKMPNSMAKLANHQFKKLDRFNEHRKKIAQYYKEQIGGLFEINKEAIYLKYPLVVSDGNKIIESMAKYNIMLEDGWRKNVIVPPKTILCKMNYKEGECPLGEEMSNKIIILPTHINITKEIAEKIVYLLKSLI
ncbi:MAG: aminotransferase class V-fold PLP-dependent enzyme [Candidatus Pacebacteria bacterium]|nr:aminotransferase class V-fold PLP-dependent enzyme [Candidatus Paceibacterota bacterium]MDD3919128.1 aminotransferase class V-fold PLP-dependent enzyme [Candidatus Paceibacterota bacterium]